MAGLHDTFNNVISANQPSQVTQQTAPSAASAPAPTGLINTPAAAVAAGPANTYTGAQTDAAKWDVAPNQTVQSQVQSIIDKNSPLMQQAETRALQKTNARGLLNSSIAVGAGQGAVLDAATPIATTDAQTYANAAQTNTANTQQANLANQNSTNTAGQFNAGANNAVNLQNSQLQTNVNLNNASEANKASQFEMANTADMNKFNAAQANDMAKTALLNDADVAKFNASESNALKKLNIDAGTRLELANIEAGYKTLMQSSAGASDLYKQMLVNVTNISSNKDMDEAAKTQAINNQLAYLNAGLGVIGKMGNLDLGDLLEFGGPEAPAPGTIPVPGTAPVTGVAAPPAAQDTSTLPWTPQSDFTPTPQQVAQWNALQQSNGS
ncbi:MAG: hypothetical protein V4772_08685 [Pseudomonadota bacterium]